MIRTLSENVVKDPCTLYVWGNNGNSELGLDDGQVLKNIAFYKKCALYKVIRQSLFENNSILQVATGNTSALFLVVDKGGRQTVVQSGQTTIAKDEQSTKTVFT